METARGVVRARQAQGRFRARPHFSSTRALRHAGQFAAPRQQLAQSPNARRQFCRASKWSPRPPTSISSWIQPRPISRRPCSALFASACAAAISISRTLPGTSVSAAARCKENCARNLPRTACSSNKLAVTSRAAYCLGRMPQPPKPPTHWAFPIPPPSITPSNVGTACPHKLIATPKFVSSDLGFCNLVTRPQRALAVHRRIRVAPASTVEYR